jgi:hypothetical protein
MYCGRHRFEWASILPTFCYSFAEAKVRWTGMIRSAQRMDFYMGLSQALTMHSLRNKFHDPKPRRIGLLKLLLECRTANAICTVDKIYAMLRVSSGFADFKINYHKSKAEVYFYFAEWLVSKVNERSLLYKTARSDRVVGDMPSWVLDWSEVPAQTDLRQQLSRTGKWLFSASGKQSREGLKLAVYIEGKVLTILGCILQTILILGYAEDRAVCSAPNVSHLMNLMKDVITYRQNLPTYPTDENIGDVLGTVTEADQQRGGVRNFWDKDIA